MQSQRSQVPTVSASGWLKGYYYVRAAFSLIWVALAFTLGRHVPQVAAVMLIVYPAWDAAANYVDAASNGGLVGNPSQTLNLVVSALTMFGVAAALTQSMNAVLAVFGVWAVLSGAFQFATGVRRWKSYGAQWAMILSGAQSALAGVFFIHVAGGANVPSIADIAPYAAFGAFYFLISAIWLTVRDARRGTIHTAA
ncbi:DUF308 domain-containing protein [Bradyrhizobium neotropicale]|uniref:DUF308 domain-containing protein n=1 Tax=Bradyrhizobium neotropicale TaxID=1497615 RepID=UPI001AD6228C|nr:DUF308 domain-containing protein [Bradyrhizobium neotropicale]MBO4224115.1 DUF308 domain-containing protein [Bradyrhizobium neotropicale]